MVKQSLSRNSPSKKGYTCIFVCFTTKVVHIDVVIDLSTKLFLNALNQFLILKVNVIRILRNYET